MGCMSMEDYFGLHSISDSYYSPDDECMAEGRAASLDPSHDPAEENGATAVGEDEDYISTLPADVMLSIFQRLDLPSLLSAQCVCSMWKQTASDPSLWSDISVPGCRAFHLWDAEFEPLILKARGGRLRRLRVGGSGVTGRSLIRLLQAKAASPLVEELDFSHCCNLKACDIRAFVHALTSSSPSPSSSYLSPATSSSSRAPLPSSSSTSASRHLSISSPSDPPHAAEMRLLNPHLWRQQPIRSSSASPPPSNRHQHPPQQRAGKGLGLQGAAAEDVRTKVQKLFVKGCRQLNAADILHLQGMVGEMDVGVCVCGQVDSLKRCTVQGCLGLCGSCWEIYRECGLECGLCCQPRLASEVIRARLHSYRRRAHDHRRSWTHMRYGMEVVIP